MIKFANFKLLQSINNTMAAEGLDWRLEKIQRGKNMWSHVLLRNMTGDEQNAHVMLYIDTESNILYPVINVNGADKFDYLRTKVLDQEGVTELSESEYEEIGEKNHDHCRLYKIDTSKFTSCGYTYDWVMTVIEHIKKLLKVMQGVLY